MRVLFFLCVTVPLAAQDARIETAPPRRAELTGFVLVNGFYNSARVNNSDVPQFAENDPIGVGGAGGAIRQTRLGILLTEPNVLGGDFSGEIDLDFFGGQQASSGGRTFPLLRLRRAIATISWPNLLPKMELLIGQEAPLVAERSPRSLASVGFPEFAGSGNLWLWIPQLRVSAEVGSALRVAFQGAVLAPGTGSAQGGFATQPDSAERTGRPYLQGRLRLAWGPSDDQSELAFGGHTGWFLGTDSLSGDTLLVSQALTADARIKVGVIELIGEAFVGKGLAGLGGGAIGQNTGLQGVPVHSKGGWAQINLRTSPQWMLGGGCGMDDPDDAGLGAAARFKNFVCEGHFEWRPRGPLVVGFEFRRLKTSYATEDFTANHLNFAAGYRF